MAQTTKISLFIIIVIFSLCSSMQIRRKREEERSSLGVASLIRNQFESHSNIVQRLSTQISSGQLLRLSGGRRQNVGFLEIFTDNEWTLVCDQDEVWNFQASNVACSQLGYGGAIHEALGNSTLGDLDSLLNTSYSSLAVNCKGDEKDLSHCNMRRIQSECDLSEKVVGIVCSTPSFSLCPGNQEPFGRKCYETHDEEMDFAGAQTVCEENGGHLLEIDNQAENNFVTEWIKHFPNPKPDQLWTGGLLNSVAGRNFLVWHHTRKPIEFTRFATEIDNPTTANEVGINSRGIILKQINDFMFWQPSDMSQNHSFICEGPQLNVGCIDETGADYNGTARRGESGSGCLPWNTPRLPTIFDGQQSWTHNFCRNPDGIEELPICFINEDEYDYCDIPGCDAIRRRDVEDVDTVHCPPVTPHFEEVPRTVSPHGSQRPPQDLTTCDKEMFQCQPHECIFNTFVCDGESDCSNGADEENCMKYSGFFDVEAGFKLQSKEEVYSDATLEECAKRCLQSKHCTCTSFSHNPTKNRCLIGNRYSGSAPYDALLERKAWNYYKVNGSVSNGCNRVKRPAQTPFEAIRLLSEREANVVEVKINGSWGGICDDGFSFNEAHVVCRQLGFELGAEQVKKIFLVNTLQLTFL